jgi:ferric-dicitrate binding protein FerR (iron transport regulator)
MNHDRLDALILKWSQAALAADEAAALDAQLRASADARRRFRQHARLDVALRVLNCGSPLPLSGVREMPAPARSGRGLPQSRMLALAAGLALLLCVATFFLGTRRPVAEVARVEETNQGCAILTRTVGAAWQGAAPRLGDSLNAGRLRQTQGLAQIEFFSGATLLLEGDAELEIVSPWEAVCHRGKARVRVPPAAQGFRLLAPGMKLVDLGTEFGVSVADGRSEVQVFEGEVEAHPDGAAMQHLKEGQGLAREAGTVTQLARLRAADFTSLEQLDTLSHEREAARFAEWTAWSQEARKDPRLIAYYTFKRWQDERWSRLINNFTEPRHPARAGGAVGATWTQGRWSMKEALEFKRPGDRVRMNLDGTYDAITLACWVKVDGLDRKYNALLLTDGYEPGEPHWQICEDGRLFFSVMYPDDAGRRHNQKYFSPVIFNRSNTGRWHHLAVTYDAATGACVQYVDGAEVSREIHERHRPGRPLTFGSCEMGNWGLPTPNHESPIRNLNGALDEFAIYRAALSAEEIRSHFENGRPE